MLDTISTGNIPTDKSKGRTNESSEWSLFEKPTPGFTNDQKSYQGFLSAPFFSNESGFYNETKFINLTHEDKDVIIYYTLDGSVPNQN